MAGLWPRHIFFFCNTFPRNRKSCWPVAGSRDRHSGRDARAAKSHPVPTVRGCTATPCVCRVRSMTMVGISSPDADGLRLTETKRSLGDMAELAWIGSIVFYSVARFAVAWGGFSEHGANPWVFGVIDVGTAYPYAKATSTVVRRAARSEWSHMALPLVAAIVMFFAPYAYLWFAAGSMPAGMKFGMITFVSVFLVAAVIGQTIKIRRLRAQDSADYMSAGRETELVIDLRGDEVKVDREPKNP